METDLLCIAKDARKAALQMPSLSLETRNRALCLIRDELSARKEAIFAANRLDVEQAIKEQLPKPFVSRLELHEQKFLRVLDGLTAVAALPDPLGKTSYACEITKNLRLYRVSCSIGVIGVIFESRPDALVQIASLCLKSGNALLLKGGREALRTNQELHAAICAATEKACFPKNWCGLLSSREEVSQMLRLDEYVDLIIPRGSNAFVRYIMQNTTIPVLGHAEGLCHVYVDRACDIAQAIAVTIDSKTQNLSVCNAAETLLVHSDTAPLFLPRLSEELLKKQVRLLGDERTREIIPCQPASEEDWQTEYLDAVLSIKIVDSLEEAIEHINHYGSHHTDCILSDSPEAIERFMTLVDSADVFANCSTRFSDGFLFGLGAEVGIATGKLHARGPMGLEGLCTYKYRLYGSGQTVGGLNSGDIALLHRPIEPEER